MHCLVFLINIVFLVIVEYILNNILELFLNVGVKVGNLHSSFVSFHHLIIFYSFCFLRLLVCLEFVFLVDLHNCLRFLSVLIWLLLVLCSVFCLFINRFYVAVIFWKLCGNSTNVWFHHQIYLSSYFLNPLAFLYQVFSLLSLNLNVRMTNLMTFLHHSPFSYSSIPSVFLFLDYFAQLNFCSQIFLNHTPPILLPADTIS